MANSYYLEDWLIEPELLRMSRKGEVKKIEPQLLAVLQYLVAHAGQVVTKDDLMAAVWKEVIVTENVLTRAISSLRKLLGDDRFRPTYIETISKTGYRLIATVKNPDTVGSNSISKLSRRPVAIAGGVLLLLALAAFSTIGILPEAPTTIYHPVAIANYSNSEYWPAISPDGRFVAYGWRGEENDNWDIYAKLIGTESTMRITDHPSTELRARWSSDGNYIYFLRYEKGGATIYKKSIVGEKAIRVHRAPSFSSGDFDISPDEKWISFNGREEQSSPLRLKLISLETGEEIWLTRPPQGFNGDIHPTFSADGSQLAFIREKNSASMQLWLYDLATQESEQITFDHLSINGFDWGSDGKSLIYGADKTGLYKLWQVNLSKKEPELLPAVDYQMVMPRVAETGRTLYSKMKDNVNIWSYQLDTKTAEPWLSTNDLNLNPVISPDSRMVCFTMNKDGIFQIWVANLDGSQMVPITNFAGQYLSAPRWSSDGKYIVFQGFLDGQSDIYKVDALGGVPENLTKSKHDDHTPYVSGEDKIYFSSNRGGDWGIWRMNMKGDMVVPLVKGNAYAPQLDSEGEQLYYCKKDVLGLWTYNLKNKKEELLIENFHPMYWGAFAVAEHGVYYLNVATKRFEFFNFSTGKSSFVYQPRARIPRLGISLHYSSDEQQLLFCQIDKNDADIMLLEEQNK